MFKDLSLNQYIAKFVSFVHWGMGAVYLLYGIFLLMLPKMLTPLKDYFPEMMDMGLITNFGVGVAIVFFIFAIYAFLVAYGIGAYKNFGRIMFLIPLYLLALFIVIFLLVALISMFSSFLIGIVLLLLGLFYAIIIYMLIYLFQFQKEMIKLFK